MKIFLNVLGRLLIIYHVLIGFMFCCVLPVITGSGWEFDYLFDVPYGSKISLFWGYYVPMWLFLIGILVILAALITRRHYESVQKINGSISPDALEVTHTEFTVLSVDTNRAFDLCKEALNLFPDHTIEQENLGAGVLKTRITSHYRGREVARYYQSDLTFHLEHLSSTQTQITIRIVPVHNIIGIHAVIDFGQNLENIRKIVWFLKTVTENTQ